LDSLRIFESLDFLYVPAPDIDSSIDYYRNILGGKLKWKIHAYGVWVACIMLTRSEPYLLLTNHFDKKGPMQIYRVTDLNRTISELRSRGWKEEDELEIPLGPCYTCSDPANNFIAIYENKRPNVMKEFEGRVDFK